MQRYVVIPAKAGIQRFRRPIALDPGFRRDDVEDKRYDVEDKRDDVEDKNVPIHTWLYGPYAR